MVCLRPFGLYLCDYQKICKDNIQIFLIRNFYRDSSTSYGDKINDVFEILRKGLHIKFIKLSMWLNNGDIVVFGVNGLSTIGIISSHYIIVL